MAYTTVTKVREEAGFVGNSNISDAQIDNVISLVQSEIDSSVSDVYSLPLPTFYKNTLTFSGAGTGSGTMTITIDSIDYALSITSGASASEVADLFRTAATAESGKSFLVYDDLGHGSEVSIYSANQSEDSTDVTITSTDPDTVQGVTMTGGTVLGVSIKLIESIATGMAAAKLLIREYGPEAQDTDKDGFKKLALYQEMLDKIQNKELKLIDFSGTELSGVDNKRIAFYPTEASRTGDDPTENYFTRNQLF